MRYNNDTIANVMFDTKARKPEYDRLNSVVSVANTKYIAATTVLHTLGFAYLAYFFRFRRVSQVSAFAISCAYYYYFTKVNQTLYKVIVDRAVINTTRELGLGSHVQPVGHFKNRGHNFQ